MLLLLMVTYVNSSHLDQVRLCSKKGYGSVLHFSWSCNEP